MKIAAMFTVEISEGVAINADMVTTVQDGTPPVITLADGQRILATGYEKRFHQLLALLDPATAKIGLAGHEHEAGGRTLQDY